MALATLASQTDLAPGAWLLIYRQSICQGDQLALKFPDGGEAPARVVERLATSIVIETGGRKIGLRPWTKADQAIPDYRGEGSRWVVAAA